MRFVLTIILAALSHSAQAQSGTQSKTPKANPDSPAVQKAADDWIGAFNNLEWENFRNSFSDDATVFLPFIQAPRRATGRAEVEALFKQFFDALRKRKPAPPYQNIQPKDAHIQMLDKDAAIFTFHLPGDESFNRRTLVFQKQKGKWLIAHLHASVFVKPKTELSEPSKP
jgi:ketosteroid isomerase-like protein